MSQQLNFKWTVSRGRDTYGYNICSLYVDGRKVTSCNGGGYDMEGTALGEWMLTCFEDKLKELPANYGSGDDNKGFYGLSFTDQAADQYKRLPKYQDGAKVNLDGACGKESMIRILEAIGFELHYLGYLSGKNNTAYLLEVKA